MAYIDFHKGGREDVREDGELITGTVFSATSMWSALTYLINHYRQCDFFLVPTFVFSTEGGLS